MDARFELLRGTDTGTPNFDTLTPNFSPPFFQSVRSLKRFNVDGLATYRAVTSEQDPPSLRGAPPVHTRSFALTVR